MNHFYNAKSSSDKCTLFSDKVLIDRRNLKHDVKDNYNNVKKFIQTELEARIVAAACIELGTVFSTDESHTTSVKSCTIYQYSNLNLFVVMKYFDFYHFNK